MKPIEAVVGAARILATTNARWALVGGIAVSVRSTPRFTADADLVVAVQNDAQAERIIHTALADGWQLSALIEQTDTGRLATARLVRPDLGKADFLFASSGIEPEIVDGSTAVEVIVGHRLPVAAVGHLLALKVLSRDDRRRPNDRSDLASLVAVCDDRQWAIAEQSCALIVQRGFGRGRDLVAGLVAVRAEFDQVGPAA